MWLADRSKEVLEKGNWWMEPWTNAKVKEFSEQTTLPNPRRMIPDELVPIRVEGNQPTVVVVQ
jgi:hypothetical protein